MLPIQLAALRQMTRLGTVIERAIVKRVGEPGTGYQLWVNLKGSTEDLVIMTVRNELRSWKTIDAIAELVAKELPEVENLEIRLK